MLACTRPPRVADVDEAAVQLSAILLVHVHVDGARGKQLSRVAGLRAAAFMRAGKSVSERDANMMVLPQRSARGRTFLAEQLNRLRVALRRY